MERVPKVFPRNDCRNPCGILSHEFARKPLGPTRLGPFYVIVGK